MVHLHRKELESRRNREPYWEESNVFLRRPDGVSVAWAWLIEYLRPGDRKDMELVFASSR